MGTFVFYFDPFPRISFVRRRTWPSAPTLATFCGAQKKSEETDRNKKRTWNRKTDPSMGHTHGRSAVANEFRLPSDEKQKKKKRTQPNSKKKKNKTKTELKGKTEPLVS